MHAFPYDFRPTVESLSSVGQSYMQSFKVACHAHFLDLVLDLVLALVCLVDDAPFDVVTLFLVFKVPDVFRQFGCFAFLTVSERGRMTVVPLFEG